MQENTVIPLLGAAVLVLSACDASGQLPTAESESKVAALPPKYLQVDQFQRCLKSKQVGTQQRWCMPVSKPERCPSHSWDQLSQMKGGEKVPAC